MDPTTKKQVKRLKKAVPTGKVDKSQDISLDLNIDDILTQIKIFVAEFRAEGGKGALISNNLETKRDSDPFHILVSCIISLRTKDTVTEKITERLFAEVSTLGEFVKLSEEQLVKLIYPTAFYENKAKQILEICRRLITEFDSTVPDDLDTLLKFKGVGRKTANLVITLGFNKPGICVDTHVARITQRLGYVSFKKYDEKNNIVFRTADDVEMILREKLPTKWWIPINDLLVTYGQTICVPISPKCSQCGIANLCKKVGVSKSR